MHYSWIDTILMGDSILRDIGEIRHTQVYCMPGLKTWQLDRLVRNNRIPQLAEAAAITIHVGTNDMGQHANTTGQELYKLFLSIQSRYPYIRLAWSQIVPRQRDNTTNLYRVINANQVIEGYLSQLGVPSIPSYQSFHNARVPIPDLYWDDGLHLNDDGKFLLRETLRQYQLKLRRDGRYIVRSIQALPEAPSALFTEWNEDLWA